MISPDLILTSVKIPPLILHLDIMSCMDKSEEQKKYNNLIVVRSDVIKGFTKDRKICDLEKINKITVTELKKNVKILSYWENFKFSFNFIILKNKSNNLLLSKNIFH